MTIRLTALNAAIRIVGIRGGENLITRVADVIEEEVRLMLERSATEPSSDEVYPDA